MAITFSCAHCGKSLTTTDDKAGRKAKCPGCGETLTVPDSVGDFSASDDMAGAGEDDLPSPLRAAGSRICPMCGAKNLSRAKTCEECGEKLSGLPDAGDLGFGRQEYAGFWLRFVAWFIDNLLLACIGGMMGLGLGLALFAGNNGNPDPDLAAGLQLVLNLVSLVISWLYFALMESSTSQATLGKLAVGIKVCDVDGRRITFGRATGRFFGKIVSGIICLIGYIMAAFTEKKQALHDQLAGTIVVRK